MPTLQLDSSNNDAAAATIISMDAIIGELLSSSVDEEPSLSSAASMIASSALSSSALFAGIISAVVISAVLIALQETGPKTDEKTFLHGFGLIGD
jgi:hypothetical protein